MEKESSKSKEKQVDVQAEEEMNGANKMQRKSLVHKLYSHTWSHGRW